MTPATRTHVLNLASLATEIDERAQRAGDVDDRYSNETDQDLCAVIGYLVDLADRCVWHAPGDYEDEKGIERLRLACEAGSKAWSYLRSGAPAVQRTLTKPSDEDMHFIAERLHVNHRQNSPCCHAEPGDAPETMNRRVLDHLYIPGQRARPSLKIILFKCASLSHARRVLKAIGLEPKTKREGESEFLEVLGERIYCRK